MGIDKSDFDESDIPLIPVNLMKDLNKNVKETIWEPLERVRL